jgi:hypothetical protein
MPRRRGYEFDERTKDEAITRWHRDNPGREDEELEVHHRLPVWFGRENGVHPDVIRSPQNAQVLPKGEHRQVDHYDEQQNAENLGTLANFWGRLFD